MTAEHLPSSRAQQLVADFETLAGDKFWSENEGLDAEIKATAAKCDSSRDALLAYIGKLERQAARAAGQG